MASISCLLLGLGLGDGERTEERADLGVVSDEGHGDLGVKDLFAPRSQTPGFQRLLADETVDRDNLLTMRSTSRLERILKAGARGSRMSNSSL